MAPSFDQKALMKHVGSQREASAVLGWKHLMVDMPLSTMDDDKKTILPQDCSSSYLYVKSNTN